MRFKSLLSGLKPFFTSSHMVFRGHEDPLKGAFTLKGCVSTPLVFRDLGGFP